MVNFIESKTAPNPSQCKYWVDLADNHYGGSIKFFNGSSWVKVSDESTGLVEVNKDVENLRKSLDAKVDKVSGKQLSTNDYTTTEKEKLAGIAAQANKTVIENVLTSTSTTNALAAAQGKELKDYIDILT